MAARYWLAWLALPTRVHASPEVMEFVLDEPVGWEIGLDRHQEIVHWAAARELVEGTEVRVLAEGPDGVLRPVEDHLPEVEPAPAKEGPRRSMPVDHPGLSDGALSGKAVYLSQAHGWMWYDTLGRFSLQRGIVHDTVEDFHNAEAANQYLVNYLENAGAAVFTPRERDYQHLVAVADDDGSGYSESGVGITEWQWGWRELSSIPYDTDPFHSGTSRRLPGGSGATAIWRPDVPADGWYAVYTTWNCDRRADRNWSLEPEFELATEAHYRITHPGGVIDRTFDQSVHGCTWQYLETLWLEEGQDSLEVELIADSDADAGRFLSADAVRIGGGKSVVGRHGTTVDDRPRWEESAILATQYNGAPSSLYDPEGNGNGTDYYARPLWAAWEHPSGEDAVCLSWHSNAYNGSARGTVTYTYTGGGVSGSEELAAFVQDETVAAIEALWDPDWNDRGLKTNYFAEVSPHLNPEMPAALLELAFHDNVDDAWHLKQPEFRRDASRALYRAIVKYFAWKDGTPEVFLPEPPVDLAVVHDAEGRLEVSWAPGVSGDPFGDDATGYIVYTSPDGRAWDNGTAVTGTSTVLDTPWGDAVFVRVAATNDGGTSFPSEVVGGLRSGDGTAVVLVVSAFDRLDTGLLGWDELPYGLGDVRRMDLRAVNPYDTSVATGEAIAALGWPFETISDERLADLDLTPYRLIVWVAGEESTEDESFSDAQQGIVRAWVEGGGALWVTGAEILWDLDYRGDESDRAFADEVLGALMASDDSQTTVVSGEGLLAGVGPLDFGLEVGAPYPVEWPDVLDSDREVIARYAGGDVAAVLGGGVALFGYPFECIGDPSSRHEVAAALLPALVPDYEPPEIPEVDTGDPDQLLGRVPLSGMGGCGCGGVPGGAGWVALIGGLLALGRRRGVV